MQTHFGSGIKLRSSALHVALSLPARVDDKRIAARALEFDLAPSPLTPWFINERREQGLLLSFANIPAKDANRYAKQLAEIVTANKGATKRA